MSDDQSTPVEPPRYGWQLEPHLQTLLSNGYDTFTKGEKLDTFFYSHLGKESRVVWVLYILDSLEARSAETGVKYPIIQREIERLYGEYIEDSDINKIVYRLEGRGIVGKVDPGSGKRNTVWLVNPYAGKDPVYATDFPVSISSLQRITSEGTTGESDPRSVANNPSSQEDLNPDPATVLSLMDSPNDRDATTNENQSTQTETELAQAIASPDRSTGNSDSATNKHNKTTHETGDGDNSSTANRLHGDVPYEPSDGPIDAVGKTIQPLIQIRSNGDSLRDGFMVTGKNEYFEGAVDAGLLFVVMLVYSGFLLTYSPYLGLAMVLFAGFWLSVSLLATGCGAVKEWTTVPVP